MKIPAKSRSRVKTSARIKISHPGSLKRVGYDPDYDERVRHAALNRAVRRYGYKKTVQKLVAVRNLTVHSNPKYSRIYEKDLRWLKEKHG